MAWLGIVGIICLPVAIGLFFAYLHYNKSYLQLQVAEAYKARELKEMAEKKQESKGKKSKGGQLVKVSGLVRADQPLTAQLSTTPCVAYKCEVKWEYEETKYYRISYDGEGREVSRHEVNSPSGYYGSDRIETRTDVSKESIHTDSKEIKFFVEDETGRVMINPAGGSMEYVQTVNDYRSASGRDYLIQYGSFRKDVGYLFRNREKQTRGFEYKEEALPVGTQVFVMGQVFFENGEAVIKRPIAEGRLVISLKSEDDLLSRYKNMSRNFLIATIVTFVGGIVLIAIAAILRR